MKAVVVIRLKSDVSDVSGRAVQGRLSEMGFTEVREVRVGKVLEFDLEIADRENAQERIKQMCQRMLVNEVVEDFAIVSLQ